MNVMSVNQTVNIVVPIYNTDAVYLNRCFTSLVKQTYRDIRVWAVDDGSQKPTADLLDTWAVEDDRITVIHQENAGVAGARNTALEKIEEGYVLFIDSDDWWDEDYVEFLLMQKEKTGCDIVQVGKVAEYDDHQQTLSVKPQVLSGQEMLEEFMSPWVAISWTVCGKLYPVSMIQSLRFPLLYIWDDYIFNRELFFSYPDASVCVCSESKYHYYMRSDSVTHSAFREKHMRSYAAVQESTPPAVLEKKTYRLWHEYFMCHLAFTYCLSITKYDEEVEHYFTYVHELRKQLFRLNVNPHISLKHKAAMSFVALMPRLFYKIRKMRR